MHPATVKKVLANQETLDIAKTAEAVMENNRLNIKRDKPKSRINTLRAHANWLFNQKEKEELRQKIKRAWNKHKKI